MLETVLSHLKVLALNVNKGRRIGVHFIRVGMSKVTPLGKSVSLSTSIAMVVGEGHISETALVVNFSSPLITI